MKILKGIFFAIVGLIALLVIVGVFLPDESHIERSIVINAPPADIFPYVNQTKRFNDWSPWARIDENTQYSYEGPASGVGATMHWSSEDPNVGVGTQKIIVSDLNRQVKSHLDFGPQGEAIATMLLEPQGSETRVTWMLDNDFGWNLMFRYFGLMLEKWVGPSYVEGLANLKEVAEG